jgi:hypothetical protein
MISFEINCVITKPSNVMLNTAIGWLGKQCGTIPREFYLPSNVPWS